MISSYKTDQKNISTGNTVKRNTLTGGWIGIWSDYAHGNKYISNIISGSFRNGIYLWNSNSNTITGNMISSTNSTSNTTYGIELDSDEEESITDKTKGTANNILINNTIVKSDSGFLVAKNSRNNTFSNNRFNGSVTSPVQSDINILKLNP
jgi:parallel beta-helix repeat protein